jgi:aspartate racemase
MLLPALQQLTSIPFLSLPELVGIEVNKRGIETVGLLASPSTYASGLYKNVFMKLNSMLIEPDQSQKNSLGRLITNAVAHDITSAQAEIIKISGNLIEKGAQILVLGCTELSLVFPKSFKLPVIDSIEVLSRALLNQYYSQEGD